MQDAVLVLMESSTVPKDEAIDSIVKNITWQMDMDRKIGALKAFQGFMWKSAYTSGKIQGVVYDDVIAALKHWKDHEKKIYIYSSGSIAAQKLLFQYSDHGNLLSFFDGHFDTTIGLKTVKESYTNISKQIELKPSEILFLTDNILECRAAREAGFQSINLRRPGNAHIADLDGFQQIKSFSRIQFQ
jgi:enolase-phosphatase E1